MTSSKTTASSLELPILKAQKMLDKQRQTEARRNLLLENKNNTLSIAKQKCSKTGEKLKDLQTGKNEHKRQHVLQKHRNVWMDEMQRLETQKSILEKQISACFPENNNLHNDSVIGVVDGRIVVLDNENNDNYESPPVSKEQLHEIYKNVETLIEFKTQYRDINIVKKESSCLRDKLNSLSTALEQEEMLSNSLLDSEIKKSKIFGFHLKDECNITVEYPKGTLTKLFNLQFQNENLQEIHLESLENIKNGYAKQKENLENDYMETRMMMPYGGWPRSDHEMYLKIKDEYSRNEAKGGMMLQRLKMQLPKYSYKEFTEHFMWHERLMSLKGQKDALKDGFREKIQEFANYTIKLLEMERLAKEEEERKRIEMEKRFESMQQDHESLRVWREEKIMALKAEAEERKRMELERESMAAAQREQIRLEREADKERIAQYHANLESQKKMQEQMMMEIAFKMKAEKVIEMKVAEERVRYRERQRMHKLTQRQLELENVKRERQKLEARLQALRDTVAVTAESNWERIFEDTVASSLSKKSDAEKPNWFSPSGFSSDNLLKDKRFQLSIMLHKNGLLNSSYAKEALASFQAPPKREQMTNIKLG